MAITTSRDTMSDMLRTIYLDRMRRHYSVKSILSQEIPRKNNVNAAEGEGIVVKCHVAGGGGFIFTDDLSTAPPSHQKVRKLTYLQRIITAGLEIVGDLMEESSDRGAVEKSILDFEVKGVAVDSGPLLNFLLYGDGTSKLAGIVRLFDAWNNL